MEKELIERIGIDKSTLYGFKINYVDFDKLKSFIGVNVEFENTGDECLYLLKDGSSFKRIRIVNDEMFDKFSVGVINRGNKFVENSFLAISLNKDRTSNLQNDSVAEYITRVKKVFEHLENKYGIYANYSEVKIKDIEINATIIIDEEFFKYGRVINLLMFNLNKRFKKTHEVKRRNSISYESESFFSGNESIGVKIYDKKRQLMDSENINVSMNLMRVEFTLKNPRKVRNALKTNCIFMLDEKTVCDFFYNLFNEIFIERFYDWDENNTKKLTKLLKELRKNETKWISKFLTFCSNEENKNRVPMMLDSEKLLNIIDNLDNKGRVKRVLGFAKKQVSKHSVFNENSKQKLDEIFAKIREAYSNSLK